jgi:hypothetical protein
MRSVNEARVAPTRRGKKESADAPANSSGKLSAMGIGTGMVERHSIVICLNGCRGLCLWL